ncbi:DUF2294 family protein [Pleurocapsales cyanobacterium LEGE 10410]|nr:DUF2294 family protein [Pleurocapsales cyanobacterium LEGE 10410]
MENTLPTAGQLERQLSQALQSFYRQQFGHSIRKITCHLFTDKVAIIAEDTVTNARSAIAPSTRYYRW